MKTYAISGRTGNYCTHAVTLKTIQLYDTTLWQQNAPRPVIIHSLFWKIRVIAGSLVRDRSPEYYQYHSLVHIINESMAFRTKQGPLFSAKAKALCDLGQIYKRKQSLNEPNPINRIVNLGLSSERSF